MNILLNSVILFFLVDVLLSFVGLSTLLLAYILPVGFVEVFVDVERSGGEAE